MAELPVFLEVDDEQLEEVRKAEERVDIAAGELREASFDLQEKLVNLNKGLRLGTRR